MMRHHIYKPLFLWLWALILLSISSCQRPEAAINTSGPATVPGFSVRLSVMSDSRAEADQPAFGTQQALAQENKVVNVRLYFLDIPKLENDQSTPPYGQSADLNRASEIVATLDLKLSDGTLRATSDNYIYQSNGNKQLAVLKPEKPYYVLAIANAPENQLPQTLKDLKEGTTDFTYKGSQIGAEDDADYFVMSSDSLQKVELSLENVYTPTPKQISINLQRICSKVALLASDFQKRYVINPKPINFRGVPEEDAGKINRVEGDRKDTIDILEVRLVNTYAMPTYWFARTLHGASGISEFFPEIRRIGQPTETAGSIIYPGSGDYYSDPYTFDRAWKKDRCDFKKTNDTTTYTHPYDQLTGPIFRYDNDQGKVLQGSDPATAITIGGTPYIHLGYLAENNCSFEWEEEDYWFKHAAPAILIKARYKPGLLTEERYKQANSVLTTATNTFYGFRGTYYALPSGAAAARQDAITDHTLQPTDGIEVYEDGICYYLAWIMTAPQHLNGETVLQRISPNEVGTLRNCFYRISLGNINYIGTPVPSSWIPRYNTLPMHIIYMSNKNNSYVFE